MSVESNVEKTPLAGANTAFDALLAETRAGNIESFVVVTAFSERYRTQVPENWAKCGGTMSIFGQNDHLIGLADQLIRATTKDLNENDRMAFGFVLMAAALGRPAPLLRIIQPPPPIQT